MKKNWQLFIESTRAKAEAHEKVAQHWATVNTYLGLLLTIVSALTTVIAAIPALPEMVTVGVSGATTLLSATLGFLQPSQRKEDQCDAAREFRSLMVKMIHCESDEQYQTLWEEYTKLR